MVVLWTNLCPGECSCEAKHSSNAPALCHRRTPQEVDLHRYHHVSSLQLRLLPRIPVPMHTSFLLLDKIPRCLRRPMHDRFDDTLIHILGCRPCLRLDDGASTMVHCPEDAARSSDEDNGRLRYGSRIHVSLPKHTTTDALVLTI